MKGFGDHNLLLVGKTTFYANGDPVSAWLWLKFFGGDLGGHPQKFLLALTNRVRLSLTKRVRAGAV